MARTLRPEWQGAASNILLAENYLCEDPGRLYTDHRAWGETVSSTLQPAPLPGIRKNRTRIGYISPDFRAHSIAWFLMAHLRNYSHAEFEIVCFSDVASPDRITEEIKSLVTEWHNIYSVPDHEVADLIRSAGVDILVDLAGHTANNRLAVFAMQPAPVQASYLGYPNTTGLAPVRYRITDKWADPPGPADNHYTEHLARLPGGFLCYTPPAGCPETSPPPVFSHKHITFGSFNVLAKISDRCMGAWCRILDQTADSRLVLKSAGLQDSKTREYHLNRFSGFGIDPGRIELVPRTTDFGTHMRWYHGIDIGLDTFPYNGTTTTCESLWMGVPVITLAGNRHAGRVGNSLLNRVGLGELVALDLNEYVSLAGKLAMDIDRLCTLRQSLRGRMATSSLCDGIQFTLELEAAFRAMREKLVGN
jgi:predicted O-linked N-acetylglucosamine transferase (SPINDLY family)